MFKGLKGLQWLIVGLLMLSPVFVHAKVINNGEGLVSGIQGATGSGGGITPGQDAALGAVSFTSATVNGQFEVNNSGAGFELDGVSVTTGTIILSGAYMVIGSSDGTNAGLVGLYDRIEIPFGFKLTEVRAVFVGAAPYNAVLSTGSITMSSATAEGYLSSGTSAFGAGSAFAFTNVYSTSTTTLAGVIGTTYQKGDIIRACATTISRAVNVYLTLIGLKQ